jgi:sugar lactone lactonase YvrE
MRVLVFATAVAQAVPVPVPVALRAQSALGSVVQSIRSAMAAGQHDTAIRLADSLRQQFPGHPSLVMLRAQAYAAARRLDDAERDVRRLMAWDARYARRALQDSILAPLRPRLEATVTPLAARADSAMSRGAVWATIEERDLVPEGTAWDPATQSVLVGSLNKRAIVAIDRDGRVSDRVRRGADGLASVVGIHVDARRGTLWAASNARFDNADDTTSSALFAFDAATGQYRGRYGLPVGATGPHFLNDLTSAPDGTVFVTDSRAGAVWVLRPGATTLVRFAAAGDVTAPNGITISADGRHLFVADMDHITVVPLAGGAPWHLEAPDSINVTGIDGLAFTGDALVAHHPLSYWRVASYPLDAAHRRITGRLIVEVNTPDSRTSTTGEVAGDHYVYIGNSQIDRMNAGTIDATTMDPIRIYRVHLRLLGPAGRGDLSPRD